MISYRNEKLNLIIKNLNSYVNLQKYSIIIKLCGDVLPKNVVLPLINIKCDDLKPGKNKIIELLDLYPCFKNTPGSGLALKSLVSSFGGVDGDRLAFLTEAWYVYKYICVCIFCICIYCVYAYVHE